MRSRIGSWIGVAAVALALPAHALATTASAAYVVNDQPWQAGAYVPALALQYNATGATNTIEHVRTGAFSVVLPGVGGSGGGIDVSPVQPRFRCGVGGMANVGREERVFVTCEDVRGAPADAQFALAFTRAVRGTAGALAYASNLGGRFSFDSAGGTPAVKHTGTGQYKLKLPHLPLAAPFDGGSVKVTPLSADQTGHVGFCSVESWAPNGRSTAVVARIRCFDRTGAPSDMAFSASFTQGINLIGESSLDTAYLWADQPSSPEYTPSASYQYNDQAGDANSVTRREAGEYTVHLPLQAVPFTPGGDVQVSTYGAQPVHCSVASWWLPLSTTQDLDVECTDAAGNPVDARFTLQWMRRP
jgi:hypothetical protein